MVNRRAERMFAELTRSPLAGHVCHKPQMAAPSPTLAATCHTVNVAAITRRHTGPDGWGIHSILHPSRATGGSWIEAAGNRSQRLGV